MGRGDFNVCFVNDDEICRLNSFFRGKATPTDVLSFPWQSRDENGMEHLGVNEFHDFLGDIVISINTAERNARLEGHSIDVEIRWLILHGALHLLGYDHETDQGEMAALELSLRERLDMAAGAYGCRQESFQRAD
ncbi:MAG: rRNA maturation RNase YbeY [Acidobacteria bacterium]|nr:rRNA maturation RNase YbeY [Acidobacteriota bacterium]